MTWNGDNIDLSYGNLDEESKEELMYEEMNRKDKEESDAYFENINEQLRETNPELFENY